MPGDRVQIGCCTLVVSLREVHDPERRRPIRITPKALGVILALVARAGRVVSREELFAEVWPDTMPTNDVLTQAIAQLRKAFSGDGGDPARQLYIETIAKTGYRLLAPVHWLADEGDGEGDAGNTGVAAEPAAVEAATAAPVKSNARPAGPLYRRFLVAAAASLALFGALLLGVYLWRFVHATPGSPEGPERPYRLIVSELGFETSPTISPDGRMVAYASELPDGAGSLVKLQASDNARPRVLSQPPPGWRDHAPAWSPDGRRIAFVRSGDQGRCEVIVVPAEGLGEERSVASCTGTWMLGFDWTPDGRGLIFGTMAGMNAASGLRILDLDSGRWRALDYPVAAGDFDYAPRYSPDGKWIGFVRNPQFGDLWRIPAEGGAAERLSHESAQINGWNWLPGGEQAVIGRSVGSQSRLYRLDVQQQRLRDFGLDDAQSPAVAQATGTLAFVRRQAQFGLFRVRLGEDGEPTGAQRLFPSLGRDLQPVLAPDGRQLLFASDRSGSYALWWGVPASGDPPRLIENFRPDTGQPPDWSSDSSSLLALGQVAGEERGIYRIVLGAGTVQRLPVPMEQPLQAVHGAGADEVLVVGSSGGGRAELALFDSASTPWRRLAAIDDVTQVRYDRQGKRVLFTRADRPGLWQADARLSAGSVRELEGAVPSLWRFRNWAVGASGAIDYLDSVPGCGARLSRAGAGRAQPACLDAHRKAAENGFSSDPASGDIYLAMAVQDGTNIGVMPLPEEPQGAWVGIINWLSGKEK